MPKLVAEDIPLLFSLLSDVVPGVAYSRAEMKRLDACTAIISSELYHLKALTSFGGIFFSNRAKANTCPG